MISGIILAITFIGIWSISNLDIPWFYFLDAHTQTKDLVVRMWPPDVEFLDVLIGPLIETIHIATLGTAVTIVIAFPIAFLAALFLPQISWSISFTSTTEILLQTFQKS